MLAQVRGFIEANGEARFGLWEPRAHGAVTANRAGFRRDSDMDGPTWYIETEAWKREVCAGFDARAVAKLLVELGSIRPDAEGNATRKERLPDGRHARVYVVNAKLWEIEL
jgi:putative DNA primase/helicase